MYHTDHTYTSVVDFKFVGMLWNTSNGTRLDRKYHTMEERKTYTVEEAAERLGISRNSAYEAVRRGEIPSLRIGRRVLIPRAALERMLEQ